MFKILMEIPERWGVIFVVKKWKFRGGVLHEIPSVVEVWIFSGTTHLESWPSRPQSFTVFKFKSQINRGNQHFLSTKFNSEISQMNEPSC